jgi:DNA-binding NarL/FixJ family response regulator
MRVVIADDNLLVREGIAAVLRRAAFEVVAEVDCAEELLRAVDAHTPDIAIVDIRMPPAYSDEGLRAAQEIRARHPATAVVILSQHVDIGTATRVLAANPERLGYVLKDRVTDVDDFAGTLRRVAAGGTALDPVVISRLLDDRREKDPLATLTPREREVLELVAEGRSNKGIAERLAITLRSAEKLVSNTFAKLGVATTGDDHRRVLAVLLYLQA